MIEELVTGKNWQLAAGIFVLMSLVKQVGAPFWKGQIGQRLLPVLPLLFGIAGAFVGICENCSTWQDKLLIGILAGYVAGHTFKVLRTTVVGYGTGEVEAAPSGKKE